MTLWLEAPHTSLRAGFDLIIGTILVESLRW